MALVIQFDYALPARAHGTGKYKSKTICTTIAACILFLGAGCSKSPEEIAASINRTAMAQKASNGVEMFELAVKLSLLELQSAAELSRINEDSSVPESVVRMEQALL